jgi:hypothetical protein
MNSLESYQISYVQFFLWLLADARKYPTRLDTSQNDSAILIYLSMTIFFARTCKLRTRLDSSFLLR